MTAEISIDHCSAALVEDWAQLRCELWPDGAIEEHRIFATAALSEPTRLVAFVARGAEGEPLGFAEASIRFDYVNGASSSPVGFLEGLYVRDAARRSGIARGLVASIEQWARERGCTELASDATIDNTVSHAAHRRLGFMETERVVCFLKRIEDPLTQ